MRAGLRTDRRVFDPVLLLLPRVRLDGAALVVLLRASASLT